MQRKIKLNCVSLVLALNLVAVCEAADLYYRMQSSTDTNWGTKGNWYTKDGSDYEGVNRVPGTGDSVVLTGGNNFVPSEQTLTVQEDTTAVASGGQFSLGRWGGVNMSIEANASLTVNGMQVNNSSTNYNPVSTFVNEGTFVSDNVAYVHDIFYLTNHSGASFTSRGFNIIGTATITNSGTMDFRSAASDVTRWLYLATATGNSTWNMNDGTITADRIVMIDGGAATINLNGGTIESEEITFRLDSNYRIVVGGDGKLVVNGNNQATFNSMIVGDTANSIGPTLTVADDYSDNYRISVTYYGTDTDSSSDYYLKTVVELAAIIPEPAHVTLVMGLFTLLYLPLSARKVAI